MLKSIKSDFKSLYLPLILSIVVSYIFYLLSIKDRIPVFNAEQVRTQIIDTKNTSTAPIKVIGPNGEQIKKDLSAVIFHFWNKGGEAIESSDILEPLYISISDSSARFIDAKLKKVSRPEITKTNLVLSKNRKNLLLNFNILDEDDGFTCQIIFEGNPHSDLVINGAVKGVKGFDHNGIKILQYISIVLALCALATIAILTFIKLFNWYTYITYRDFSLEFFFEDLRNNNQEKLEKYFNKNVKNNQDYKKLVELYQSKDSEYEKFRIEFLDKQYEENKRYFLEGESFNGYA